MALSDKFTVLDQKFEHYADFLTNLDKNPSTGFLGRVTNEESVRQSLVNWCKTGFGERFYNTRKGTNTGEIIFGQTSVLDHAELDALVISMRERLEALEPRAKIRDVQVIEPAQNLDKNTIVLRIVYSILNILEKDFTLDITVERVR